MALDPQSLLSQSNCYNCYSGGEWSLMELALLAQVSSGPGIGGGGQIVAYTGASPVGLAPSNPNAYGIAVKPGGTIFIWSPLSFTWSASAPASNRLLNGLVSYWQLAATPSPDLKDGNPATLSGGTLNAIGGAIANGPYVGFVGSVNTGYSVTPCPANMRLGAGSSFSLSIWVKPGVQLNAISSIAGQYTGTTATSAWLLYFFGGSIHLVGYGPALNNDFVVAAQPSNAWHHLVVGFDSTTKLSFAQLDGGARVTSLSATDLNSVVAAFRVGDDTTGSDAMVGGVNESGFWNRVLTTTDVATLYNGGAGLPFASFGP